VSWTPNPPLDPIPEPGGEPVYSAPPQSPLVQEDPPWGVIDVILIAVFSIIATSLLTGIAFGIVHTIPRWRHYTVSELLAEPLAVIPPQAVGYLLTLFFMILVIRRATSVPFWNAVKWRWPARILPFITVGVILSVLIQLSSTFLPIPKTLPIDEFFKTTHAAWVLAIFGVFVAPLLEELFFRGFLYPVLYRRVGVFAATVISSLLFAFTHEGQLAHAWAPLLVLFVVGVALTYVRIRTQSVASSFLVHASYNAFIFGMIFVATGGFRHMDKLK
jgi:hypothetical protein